MTISTPSNNKKPQAQIIIEEAELIRFLQTGEGAELIGKAYNVPVTGFLDFVKNFQLSKKEPNQKFPGWCTFLLSMPSTQIGLHY